jgi:hypothetical protein
MSGVGFGTAGMMRQTGAAVGMLIILGSIPLDLR